MLHEIEHATLFYGLTLNFNKTFLLRLGAALQLPTPTLRALGQEQVIEKPLAKTLGFPLGAKKSTFQTVRSRLASMRSAMAQYRFIWQSKLPKIKKAEKYRALVFSKGTWGFHLLELGDTEFRKIESQHQRCLRRILRIKTAFISHISSTTVLIAK